MLLYILAAIRGSKVNRSTNGSRANYMVCGRVQINHYVQVNYDTPYREKQKLIVMQNNHTCVYIIVPKGVGHTGNF